MFIEINIAADEPILSSQTSLNNTTIRDRFYSGRYSCIRLHPSEEVNKQRFYGKAEQQDEALDKKHPGKSDPLSRGENGILLRDLSFLVKFSIKAGFTQKFSKT